MNKKLIYLICIIIAFIPAIIGSLFTTADSQWYESVKPSITPPSFVFPIVWNILYLLIGISLAKSWISSKKKQKKSLAYAYSVNLILNAIWSPVFFGLHLPGLAFLIILGLLISILFMIKINYKINKKSSYLLIPYLLWIIFASILNGMIAFSFFLTF